MKLLEVKVHYYEIEVCHNQVDLEESWTNLELSWNWVCTSMKSSYQWRENLEVNMHPRGYLFDIKFS